MQLLALSSAALFVAGASAAADASYAFNLNSSCVDTQPRARIINRCPYKVHVWSVLKGMNCPGGEGAVVEPGQIYQENYRPAVNGVGTSIKISKSNKCGKGEVDILQLEYFPEKSKPGFNYNFLDVSYVDCTGKSCPTADKGFYLKSGNQDGKFKTATNNEICPILSCTDFDSCAKHSYVLPEDRQTKSCDNDANLDFYMCGSEAPGSEPKNGGNGNNNNNNKPAPSSQAAAPAPSSKANSPAPPAYTSAPAPSPIVTPAPVSTGRTKTEFVYVTKVVKNGYQHKRHEHAHRHQHFRA